MKTIANLANLTEAQTLQALMKSRGVEAFIPDEFSAGVAPHFFLSPTGIRLQVAGEDEEKAIEIINEVYSISG